MSYAGPQSPKKSGRPSLKRAPLTPSSSHAERNAAFIAGAVVGAAVGAGVALLLAPRSGRSTRRRLARSGHRLTQRGRDAWHDLADELRAARRRRNAVADADETSAENAQRKSFSLRAASSL